MTEFSFRSLLRLELCFKLFLVMGISFTLEFIFWCIEPEAVGDGPSAYWVIADLFNFLVRPILVFYFLAWNKCKESTTSRVKKSYVTKPLFVSVKKSWFPPKEDPPEPPTSLTNDIKLSPIDPTREEIISKSSDSN